MTTTTPAARKVNIPSAATLVLSLIAGVLVALNQTTFDFGHPWKEYITIGLVALAGLGITPLVGAKFRSALHLSHAVSLAITGAATALSVAVTTFPVAPTVKAIIIGVLAVLSGLGFAPASSQLLAADRNPAPGDPKVNLPPRRQS